MLRALPLLIALAIGLVVRPAAAAPQLPARVDAIEIHGLWRTLPRVVTRELPWKEGESVTPEAWDLGVQRLWNMGVFSRVQAQLEEREGRIVAVFDLEERWTILLMLRGGAGGGAFWLRTGLTDINTLERFVETGLLYERFGPFNGGQLWVQQPRLFDERQSLLFAVDRLARPRIDDTVLRSGAHLEFLRERSDVFAIGWRAEGFVDQFLPLPHELPHHPGFVAPAERSAWTGPTVRWGRVDTIRLQTTGWSLEVRPSAGITDAAGFFALAQVRAELLAFRAVGDRWTFGLRAQGAASTGAPVAQRFYLGGLDLVRGYPDNFLRTLDYALVNLEARWVLWDSTWLAFMPAAFVDAALARREEGGAGAMLSAGAGMRFLVPRFVRSGLRVDVAWPVAHERRPGLSVGVYQFF